MTKQIPDYLRLHVEEPLPKPDPVKVEEFRGLNQLCQSFRKTTGWHLQYIGSGDQMPAKTLWSAPLNPRNPAAAGHLAIVNPDEARFQGRPQTKLDDAGQLAQSMCQMLGEIHATQEVLWQREAELATAVPLVQHHDEPAQLALRLESVLQSGAESIGCQAAALYLLDDDTSLLKLRAAWGLPKRRFLEPPRDLASSLADLEALAGHAVALEDTSLLPHWQSPENFPAAVCVPVSTATVQLGTLWIFCERSRDFTDEQTNLIEIIAGRLAADLEREILLRSGAASKDLNYQLAIAGEEQGNQLPRTSPLVENWDVAAELTTTDSISSAFYNWLILEDGRLAVAIGQVQGTGLQAAMSVTALQTAIRSHAWHQHDACQMLQHVNRTIWAGSVGDKIASLFYAIIAPDTGRTNYAVAGDISAQIIRPHGSDVISDLSLPIGVQPGADFQQFHQVIAADDLLIVLSDGYRQLGDPLGQEQNEQTICEILQDFSGAPAAVSLKTLRNHFCAIDSTADFSLMAIQRHP